MKIFSVVFLTFPLLCLTYPVENQDTASAIVVEDSDHAESESSQISKRSGGGSFDIVNHLKTGILSGVSRASASLASGSSGGSGFKSIDSHNSVDFDPWTLKKSVLNTLFQAVKAITGGVTAIKGQLIKGSGYALSASGKLVSASGDKVTDVGKAIVHSAQLIPAGPGIHPIAKFGSLSSLSSSSISGASKGSIPLSSSGSGPAVHSETITTYEIPSGHGSYGPPSKAPSYSSTQHQYLPPPGAYSGGAPFTGAVAFEHSPISYLPTKYGIPLVEGPTGPSHYGISPRDAKSAAKALKEIIHLLPTTETKTQTEQIVEQYPIPNDPIPDFKLPPFGPIESISHTETITTAFGTPLKNSKLSSSPSSPLLPTPSNIPEKITLDNHGHPTPIYNPHAYDVFHSLSLKKINSLTDHDFSSLINNNFNNKPVKSNVKHTKVDFDPTPQLPPLNKPFTSFNLNANKQISSAKQNYYLNYLNSFPTSKPLVSKFNPQPFQIPLSSHQIHSINDSRRRRRTTKRHTTSKSKSKVHSRHTFPSLNKIQKSLGIQVRNSMNFNKLLLY